MNSDYIRSLPPQVKKRINALKNLQKKHMETEVEFHKEFHMLELKYQEKMSELTQQVIYGNPGFYPPHGIDSMIFPELNLNIIRTVFRERKLFSVSMSRLKLNANGIMMKRKTMKKIK